MIGREGLATAMIDVSDGLATDLGHIMEQSKAGAIIHVGLLPVARSVSDLASAATQIDAVSLALASGEEYELAFCSPAQNLDRIRELSERIQLPITRIGEVTPGPGLFIERDGQTVAISAKGFEHEI